MRNSIVKPLLTIMCSLSIQAQAENTPLGYGYDSSLNIAINKACVGSFMRNISPGPYSLKVSAFRGLLDKKTGLVSRQSSKLIKDANYSFGDYSTVNKSSSTSTVDRLKASMGLPLPSQAFEFEDFEFSIPMGEIISATFDTARPKKVSYFESLTLSEEERGQRFVIAGLKFKVVDKMTNVEVFKSLVGFKKPSKYTADPLLDDISLNEESKLNKLWPQVAVHINKYRSYYVRSGKHEGGDDQDCRMNNYLNFEIEVDE